MKKTLSYAKDSLPLLILAPLLMIIEVLADLLQPTLMSKIIDVGVANRDWSYIMQLGSWMLITTIIGLACGFGCYYVSARATAATGARLRAGLFDHIQTLSFAELDRLTIPSLVTRLTNDIAQIQGFLLMSQRILVRAPFLTIGGLVLAFILSKKLSMIFLLIIPLFLLIIITFVRRSLAIFATVQVKLDNLNTITRETLLGVRVIKAFATWAKEKVRFQKANMELLEWQIKSQKVMIMMMPLLSLTVNMTIVAALWWGGYMVIEGSLEIGKIMAFITYVMQILQGIIISSMIMMHFSRAKASSLRVEEVLATTPAITDGAGSQLPNGWDIVFEDVSFRYYATGSPVLSEINVTIPSGARIGVIGPTGCGKTTFVSLLPRLYEACSGRITIGGVDIRALPLAWLHQHVGMVLQKSVIFSGTIATNLAFGNPLATEEEMADVLQKVLAEELYEGKPLGLDTPVTQRGTNLSGGQKQRLSIARTLLAKPSIFIMDDATSALDMLTERALLQTLATEPGIQTRIIVAQRISALMDADQIIVLDHGRIESIGNHETLLQISPVYRTIARIQLGEEVLKDV